MGALPFLAARKALSSAGDSKPWTARRGRKTAFSWED